MRKIKVNYLKDPNFRNYHADGVYGGANTPTSISMAFFSETGAMPVSEETIATDQGQITETKVDNGQFTHEKTLHCQVIMGLKTAEVFHRWLGDKIKSCKAQEDLQ